MPGLTRWYLKSAFAYLLLSWFLEGWRLCQPELVPTLVWAHRVTIFHLFFVGWLTQMIFGVAHWMFPPEAKSRSRGNPWLGWGSFVLLNAGLLMRGVTEPLLEPNRSTLQVLLLLSGILQWLAALSFALHIWRRIRPKGKSKHHATA